MDGFARVEADLAELRRLAARWAGGDRGWDIAGSVDTVAALAEVHLAGLQLDAGREDAERKRVSAAAFEAAGTAYRVVHGL